MSEKQILITDFTTDEVVQELQDRGYFIARTPLARRGKTHKSDLSRWSGEKYRFGIVTDTHLGSRYQQVSHLYSFYALCARRRIDTILHCGDLVDGERMYRGQEYEIFVHGYDAQLAYACDVYPKRKNIKTLMISGNHDQSFVKSAGANIVRAFCARRDDITYLGDDWAVVQFGNVQVALFHGRGGVAYARSYRGQKVIEQLAPEQKPNMLFMGHYHVPCHLPGYRNVEMLQLGCFQSQTPYLVGKGLYPFVSGVIVTIQEDEGGIAKVLYEWVPFYEMKKDDY